jgi:dUTP pyrophosphatase
MKLRIKRLHPEAIIPTRAHPTDSGLDLHACLPGVGSVWIPPGERVRFNTGIAIELPRVELYTGLAAAGYEAQVRGRSGLTAKGIIACGGLGTVDNGYRGDIGVTLSNQTFEGFMVRHGDRIAQLVVCPVVYPEVEEVSELTETTRGTGGFGSTGV